MQRAQLRVARCISQKKNSAGGASLKGAIYAQRVKFLAARDPSGTYRTVQKMSIVDPKFVELTADVLDFFFIKQRARRENHTNLSKMSIENVQLIERLARVRDHFIKHAQDKVTHPLERTLKKKRKKIESTIGGITSLTDSYYDSPPKKTSDFL